MWVWGQKGDKCSKLSTWLYNFIIANNCKHKLKKKSRVEKHQVICSLSKLFLAEGLAIIVILMLPKNFPPFCFPPPLHLPETGEKCQRQKAARKPVAKQSPQKD